MLPIARRRRSRSWRALRSMRARYLRLAVSGACSTARVRRCGSRCWSHPPMASGDVVLGLPSTGVHTNGYSLARKPFFEGAGHQAETHLAELDETIGAALLKPHVSYLRPLEGLLDNGMIKGLAHITGGGLL